MSVFRIQPLIEEEAVQQTFENVSQTLLPLAFTKDFQTWIGSGDFPYMVFRRPGNWQRGDVELEFYERLNAQEITLAVIGWVCGAAAPVVLAQSGPALTPADDLLHCNTRRFDDIDFSPYDLIGLAMTNTSHPAQTTYEILAFRIIFSPRVGA
jgi:hypothetical protein